MRPGRFSRHPEGQSSSAGKDGCIARWGWPGLDAHLHIATSLTNVIGPFGHQVPTTTVTLCSLQRHILYCTSSRLSVMRGQSFSGPIRCRAKRNFRGGAMKGLKRARLLVGTSLLMLGAGTLWLSTAAQAACQKQPLAPAMEMVNGEATLCEVKGGVTAAIRTTGLTAGNAYTFWFVYIDDLAKCTADGMAVCIGMNEPNEVPDAALGRLTDVVAPRNGKATVTGSVPGLLLSKGSQVLLLVKGHGPANTTDNLARARQLPTPEDPTIGTPQEGIVNGAVADVASVAAFNQ